MAVALTRALVVGLMVGGTAAMLLGTGGYRYDRDLLGRVGTAGGFGVFALALFMGGSQYALGSRSFRPVGIPIAVIGVVLCGHGIRLVKRRWARSEQLATVMAVFLLLVLPFELYPALHVLAQEWFASRTVEALTLLGAQPTVELTGEGYRTVVRMENGSFLNVVRECNGVYAGALFTALVVGARTTVWRKVGGIGFALVAVVLVNQARLVFVGLAMANDWFGPFLTDTGTLQMTYYVAEFGVGQPLIVAATVAGFLIVDRWIPDILGFLRALVTSVNQPPLGRQ
jgi:archaeosortase A (PGF-CTERM-specific)